MLSLIVPCYNEGERIELFIQSLLRLWPRNQKIEKLIFVDDGSTQESKLKMLEIIKKHKDDFFFDYELIEQAKNGGKGMALRTGFLQAKTPYVGFLDADGATRPDSAAHVFAKLKESDNLVSSIGSRVLMLGMDVKRSPKRHYVGRVFATFVSQFFKIYAYDTQCGCKFYKTESILPLFDKITDNRWTWDTQLLILLLKSGHACIEVPVNWSDTPGSKVSMIRDPLRMLWELLKFKYSKLKEINV